MTNEELAAFIEESRSQSPTSVVLGISVDLIRQYADQYKSGDENGFRNLITVFDSLRKGEAQARNLSQAYLNQIIRMQKAGPITEPRRVENAPSERSTRDQGSAKSQGQGQRHMAQAESKETREKPKEKLSLDLGL